MRISVIACYLLITGSVVYGQASGFIYSPEGDSIVITNGTRLNNKPLYCHERFPFIWSGELPLLSGEMGGLAVCWERSGVQIQLKDFSTRIMRCRPGRMEWECRDTRLSDLKVTLSAVALADANGFAASITAGGSKPGDKAVWHFSPAGGQANRVNAGGQGFQIGPSNDLQKISGSISAPMPAVGENVSLLTLAMPVPVSDDVPQYFAVTCEKNGAAADAKKAFDDGFARAVDFSRRLVIETPDPYLNAGAPFSVSACDGTFVDPTFVHGGTVWRMRMPGWRTMGGSIYYGWIDRVKRAVKYWGSLQVKEAPEKKGAQYSGNGCMQEGNSRFFGAGFINYPNIPQVYEFQTQFFDDAVRAWRASADPELEKMLLPMLELHLQRCKECFDPDGDWTYESYNNTWPNDSIWFNGGGTPEQSGYVYYGHRAAADMRRRAGDTEGAAKHDAIAENIKKAVNELLWMPECGQFASYVEPWGHKRQMPDAWVYAQHIPIETGLTTPEQAWKAMYYTEWAMERFILPYGEMRHTSNFVPGQWSVRELYHGDNFAMALGYFLSGQGDDGWQLLRGALLESMYGDGVAKAGYSRESGQFGFVNHISPGGLSHPNCAIDFIDIITPCARAIVEGLFGYRPDYPNGFVRIEPSFPSAWDHASIMTPDFSLEFRDNIYRLKLQKQAAVKFGVPVRAAKVKQVLLNGQPVEFRIEPWAGYGMLRVETPVTADAELKVETEGAVVVLPVIEETETEGRQGHRLVLNKKDGDVPRYQITKVTIPETVNLKVLREAPETVVWKQVDMDSALNGDLRTIFKQRYESPRPDRVSMRIAFDGWGAWTFSRFWGIATPEIGMENVFNPDATNGVVKGDSIVTPQRVQFRKPGEAKNIAFTSLWDNWPVKVSVPVNAKGEAVWLLIAGSTTPMQGKIANAVVRFHYADGKEESLDLVPPKNFWALCKYGNVDYTYARDGFAFGREPPAMVQLGRNCRAMVYGWKLRPGVELEKVELETLSLDVVIGLMGVSIMNPSGSVL